MFNLIHQSVVSSISPLYSIHYFILPSLVTPLSHPLIHYNIICITHSLLHYNTCIISSSSPLYIIYQTISSSIYPLYLIQNQSNIPSISTFVVTVWTIVSIIIIMQYSVILTQCVLV